MTGTLIDHTFCERRFKLYIPDGIGANRPLIFCLHPGLSHPDGWRTQLNIGGICSMDTIADAGGYYVCYPYGSGRDSTYLTWNAGWCCGFAQAVRAQDVAFIKRLRTKLMADYSIDSAKVYLCGFSNGAMLSYAYVAKHPTDIAGCVLAAGTLVQDFDQCAGSIPMEIIHISGSLDAEVPQAGGIGGLTNSYRWPVAVLQAEMEARGVDFDFINLIGASHSFSTIQATLASQEGTDFASLVAGMVG